ncbi:MAG: dTMP kinase [Candidatus Lloydbacteria bacterium RIFCSPHIGHO2_02_FULL_54_17]|uniref:Thymidylate kinase n=1 Tax=Candidatus Lloydbacteria bacterium RIFCSPHIGHO2_02_FULL_54_17 TaxID=1798664 RepID=A0A1G2DE13_9BACT|nr:MAG: dTMP kinase [Candidatus Lloydbacteria bacterium RIFCSPHIGHO2_01_FULL_54_11]OGZ11018.1 MAG: dTMP kinase [Candidatus Lloydbacteria bacterium RIFCSPHIGHO2_02_FULL_54_17]OGZ13169.1 MAG: dTMP kinase [Candidatus Lloydbacteria bacterium RIFCSPLOWO2_01_FULL_54_18]OGZ15513.1 MAG: dTMP kinase [Candidatus Lloydbacteria bacterium RIFCSPLOWO2_02_FULL_54_12]
MQGKFIVIEGGDGVGKGTIVGHLRKSFPEGALIYTREPGGTEVGEKVREILLGCAMLPATEMMLHFSYRPELFERIVLPAVRSGKHVIDERHIASTYAYQIVGRECNHLLPGFLAMEHILGEIIVPDLYIYLDLDPKIGAERLKKSGKTLDRFELEGEAFHQRVRKGYLEYFKNHRSIIVDVSRDIAPILQDVEEIVRKETGL